MKALKRKFASKNYPHIVRMSTHDYKYCVLVETETGEVCKMSFHSSEKSAETGLRTAQKIMEWQNSPERTVERWNRVFIDEVTDIASLIKIEVVK